MGDKFLELSITWIGKLPQTKDEVKTFMLKNKIGVKVAGSKRKLHLDLNWKMTKPDFDYGTPENEKIAFNTNGHNPRRGDYSLSNDIDWSVVNKVIEVNWTGLTQFDEGWLATTSPIKTAAKFKILLDQADLI